jgi:hypothetical protein
MTSRRVALALAIAIVFVPGAPSLSIAQTRALGALPADVQQDSRNRLTLLKPGAQGVAAIRLHGSGVDVRWSSPLGRQLTELAILTSARQHDQPYEWSLHEMEGLAVGLDPRVIDAVRRGTEVPGFDGKQVMIVQVGRQLFGDHVLNSALYAEALQTFGTTDLVDLVSLMAQYAATATRLSAINQQMPVGWKQFLPLRFTPPDDIHPDSRSRLPYVKAPGPEAAPGPLYSRGLAPEGTGPPQIRRHGSGMKLLEGSLGRRLMALAALVTAHEHHQRFHGTLAEAAARRDGVEVSVIDLVRNDRPLTGLADKDAVMIQFGRELFRNHFVSAATYARALGSFGERDLVDVIELMAGQVSDAVLLTAFDQH